MNERERFVLRLPSRPRFLGLTATLGCETCTGLEKRLREVCRRSRRQRDKSQTSEPTGAM